MLLQFVAIKCAWWNDFEFHIPTWQQFDQRVLRHLAHIKVEQAAIIMIIFAVVGALFLKGTSRSASP